MGGAGVGFQYSSTAAAMTKIVGDIISFGGESYIFKSVISVAIFSSQL